MCNPSNKVEPPLKDEEVVGICSTGGIKKIKKKKKGKK
jgi:hypothetical protein